MNTLKITCAVSSAAIMGMLIPSIPALATSFNFSYTGPGVNASGVITLGNSVSGGGYLITGVSGLRNGTVITALVPREGSAFAHNDNLFFVGRRELLSGFGFDYIAAGVDYNVSYNDLYSYYQESSLSGNNFNQINLDSFSATPNGSEPELVSEPDSTIGLLALSVIGVGSFSRKVFHKS